MRRIFLGALLLFISHGAVLAAPRLSGYTNMFYDPGHGTQVEYLGTDGRTFLWYPGNKVLVPGRWKTRGGSKSNPAEMCFLYPSNSYNPITKAYGGGWECRPMSNYTTWMTEQAKGDTFGLARSTAVPFVLSSKRTTLAKLAKKPVESTKPEVGQRPLENPNKGLPSDLTKATCEQIVAAANSSRFAKIRLGQLYAGGMWMGKNCVKTDYVRGFKILQEMGAKWEMTSTLNRLKSRAASGNPLAISGLRKLKAAGFID